MNLRLGLFGFGRTGALVAKEIIKDDSLTISWVMRKSVQKEGAFASHVLGFEHAEG